MVAGSPATRFMNAIDTSVFECVLDVSGPAESSVALALPERLSGSDCVLICISGRKPTNRGSHAGNRCIIGTSKRRSSHAV